MVALNVESIYAKLPAFLPNAIVRNRHQHSQPQTHIGETTSSRRKTLFRPVAFKPEKAVQQPSPIKRHHYKWISPRGMRSGLLYPLICDLDINAKDANLDQAPSLRSIPNLRIARKHLELFRSNLRSNLSWIISGLAIGVSEPWEALPHRLDKRVQRKSFSTLQRYAKCCPRLATVTKLLLMVAFGVVLVVSLVSIRGSTLFQPPPEIVSHPIEDADPNYHRLDPRCALKGYEVCSLGTIADAKLMFPFELWPVSTASWSGRLVSSSCSGYVEGLSEWGYQGRMQLCRLCSRVVGHVECIGGRVDALESSFVSLSELSQRGHQLVPTPRL